MTSNGQLSPVPSDSCMYALLLWAMQFHCDRQPAPCMISINCTKTFFRLRLLKYFSSTLVCAGTIQYCLGKTRFIKVNYRVFKWKDEVNVCRTINSHSFQIKTTNIRKKNQVEAIVFGIQTGWFLISFFFLRLPQSPLHPQISPVHQSLIVVKH